MQLFTRAKALKASQKLHLHRQRAINESFQRNLLRRETVEYNRQRSRLLKASKLQRREEWFLQHLAPRRDVGEPAETYGTMPAKQLQPPRKPKEQQRAWGIAVGDRVCVVAAGQKERGKIGKVRKVSERTQTVVVKGLNMADFPTPAHELAEDQQRPAFYTRELPLPLAAVRLVYPFTDRITQQKTDMIVDNLTLRNKRRYVVNPESQIEIPWPNENKHESAEPAEYDVDTLRIDVDEETWTPKLLSLPFPGSVIDELRNKYGRFRTRHDDEYVEYWQKRNEEAKATEERKKAAMMTPKEEWAVLRKREAERREEPVLSEKVLETIGRVMAKSKGLDIESISQQEVRSTELV